MQQRNKINVNDMLINTIDERICSFWQNFFQEYNKIYSLQIKELECYDKTLVGNVISLEAINNECYRCIKYLNSEVSRLEKEKGVKRLMRLKRKKKTMRNSYGQALVRKLKKRMKVLKITNQVIKATAWPEN